MNETTLIIATVQNGDRFGVAVSMWLSMMAVGVFLYAMILFNKKYDTSERPAFIFLGAWAFVSAVLAAFLS